MAQLIDLRDAPYREVLELQRNIFNRRVELRRNGQDTGDDVILTVEHQPVYTLGRHADPRNVVDHCWSISDKARAVAGGVLEAILYLNHQEVTK